MRILKVVRAFYPAVDYGGPIGKTLAITKGLVQRGHEVTIYTSNLLNPRRKMFSKTIIREVEGARVVYLNSLFNYRWESFTPEIFGLCKRELRKFDIVHIYGYRDFLSTIVCFYAHKYSIPYVLEPMGMLIPIIRSLAKKRLYDALWGRKLVAGVEQLIATSESEYEEILSCGVPKEKIFLRRNGIDLFEFEDLPERGEFRSRFGIANSEPLVLYLGRIFRHKGLELLVKGFGELSLPQARLAIVGPDGRDGTLSRIVQLKKQLGLNEHLIMPGVLLGRNKLAVLVDADVVVLPSQYESFGNVVAEAIACGTPVIVTDRCGIAPYVKDRVGLVVKYDEGEIREAIHQLLVDKQLREKFIQNTGQVKRELSWEEPIRQMEELYKSIVEISKS